jgi:hypothetical protein
VALSAAIINIAQVRRRFGYRRIHDLLRPEFSKVNHKRVYRLYCVAKLAVKKRKKVKLPVSERVPLQIAQNVNEVCGRCNWFGWRRQSLSSVRAMEHCCLCCRAGWPPSCAARLPSTLAFTLALSMACMQFASSSERLYEGSFLTA